MPEHCVIGIDIGGTKALTGVVSADGEVAHRAHRHHGEQRSAEHVIEAVVAAVREAEDAAGAPAAAVGVGIPSLVDQRTGVAGATMHLPLGRLPVRDLLSERLGVPVALDNDATCAMVAEHRAGAARGAQTALLLTLGTGIGGGIVCGGAVMRGASGAAGEFGHITLDHDGGPCSGDCPNLGCFETLVSGTALGRRVREIADDQPHSAIARAAAGGRALDGALATELAHDGDPVAFDLLDRMGELLGIGIASLVNIFNPEVVVVGGGVMAAGELLLTPARAAVQARALSPSRDDVSIVATEFGESAGMVGAAMLAHDRLATE
ncbi:MAG: ROK family protein [Baekduia sp.]